MSWYKEGTVNIEQGSKTVTGISTKWTNPLIGVCAGQMLILKTTNTIEICEIASVQSDTQLTLANQYSGASKTGVSYEIPTAPKVSIEALALRISEMLNYYQQQMDGWQSILTGEGEVTLTAPDGRVVTIKSQYSIANELIEYVKASKKLAESSTKSAELANQFATSANNASSSAKNSESSAKTSAEAASKSAQAASQSANNASDSAELAKISEINSKTSEANAAQSAIDAKNAAESINTSIDTSNFIKKSGENSQSISGSLNVKELTENGERVYSPNNKPTSDDIGSLPATKTVVDDVPIYMVGENVNHVGKLTVNDKTVLTEDDKFKIESMILYPGGDESNPPTIVRNQRIVVNNPFNAMNVIARLELYLESTWFDFQQLDDVGSGLSVGVKLSIVGNDKIVIQSGNYGPCLINASIMGGHPFGTDKIYTSAQYRIRIIKIGD